MHEISDWMMFKISISALVEICGTDISIITIVQSITVLFMHIAHTLAWGISYNVLKPVASYRLVTKCLSTSQLHIQKVCKSGKSLG